jgi:DNA ligase-1
VFNIIFYVRIVNTNIYFDYIKLFFVLLTGKFQSTVSIVKTAGSGRWNEIKYYIFDAPNIKKPFSDRMKDVQDYFTKHPAQYVTVLEHVPCTSVNQLKAELKKVEAKGK